MESAMRTQIFKRKGDNYHVVPLSCEFSEDKDDFYCVTFDLDGNVVRWGVYLSDALLHNEDCYTVVGYVDFDNVVLKALLKGITEGRERKNHGLESGNCLQRENS